MLNLEFCVKYFLVPICKSDTWAKIVRPLEVLSKVISLSISSCDGHGSTGE